MLSSNFAACTRRPDFPSYFSAPLHAALDIAIRIGGAELYEAAVLLREILRGRAALFIQDRTDIAGAAEADGVILSSRGMLLHSQLFRVHHANECAQSSAIMQASNSCYKSRRADGKHKMQMPVAGIPTVVARRSLPDNANLVGRKVASGQEAQRAAADGASLVIVEVAEHFTCSILWFKHRLLVELHGVQALADLACNDISRKSSVAS